MLRALPPVPRPPAEDEDDPTTRDLGRRRPRRHTASGVVVAPRGKLVRRSLDSMRGCVIAKRYRISRAIGAGGMGTVYEAIDIHTGCLVALKALSGEDRNSVAVQRLRREAETAVSIRSDHVCQVHYLGVEGGTPFIVMERLHGETLRARLSRSGPLSVPDAISVTLQLLDALAATHASGAMHRDVKPSNVFITSPAGCVPRIKLIDFGLAKLLRARDAGGDARDAGEITAPNGIPGTLHYLAPEQLVGADDLDQRVDIYAAGLVLYETLTGERAYANGAFDEVVRRIVFEAPPRAGRSRADVPALVDDALTMALAKERSRRFLTASAFHKALSAASAALEPEPPTARRDDDAFRSQAETIIDIDLSIIDPDTQAYPDDPMAETRRPTGDEDDDFDEVTGVAVDVDLDLAAL